MLIMRTYAKNCFVTFLSDQISQKSSVVVPAEFRNVGNESQESKYNIQVHVTQWPGSFGVFVTTKKNDH